MYFIEYHSYYLISPISEQYMYTPVITLGQLYLPPPVFELTCLCGKSSKL